MQKSVIGCYAFCSILFCIFFVVYSLEKILKWFKKFPLADRLSLHDGARSTCNKPRYPVTYVNLKKIFVFFLNFTIKRYVHDIFCFHHSCISIFLIHSPACFSLLCMIFNDCFTSLVSVRNTYHINYGVIQGFPVLRTAVTIYVKKTSTFSRVSDFANQLLTRHLPFVPFGQVDD